MKLTYLLGAAAMGALMTGAAHAQSTSVNASPPSSASASSAQSADPVANPMAAAVASGTPAAADPAPASAASTGVTATSATTYGQGASVTATTTTNGPVPDTAENRRKYGAPMSNAGKRTAAKGN